MNLELKDTINKQSLFMHNKKNQFLKKKTIRKTINL